jgi:hypothetical protein
LEVIVGILTGRLILAIENADNLKTTQSRVFCHSDPEGGGTPCTGSLANWGRWRYLFFVTNYCGNSVTRESGDE